MVDATALAPPDLKMLVEALILVSDGPVAVETLATALQRETGEILEVLAQLEQDYATHGIRLQRLRERVQFVSAPEAAEQVQQFLGLDSAPRLSAAALETLAIIAYRQPITRPQIESIRGVNCDGVIHNLLLRGLIEEAGRLETVGHPILYGTTFEFLQYFGLTTLDQMPPLPDELRNGAEGTGAAEFLKQRESGQGGSANGETRDSETKDENDL